VAVGAGADPDRIVASARAYAAEIRSQGRERTEFVKQAMTWLNQRLFEDYGSAQPVENAGGWRPGLRTTEEILADLAREKGNGDELEGKGRGLGGNPPLGEASLRPRDGEQELVRRETRKPGMQSLGGIFRKAGMVANVVSEARAVRDAGRCEMDGPVPMARVVND
jgi:hypothetical protein